MKIAHLKTLALIVLTTAASLVWADPAGRVGRISYTQGQVLFRTAFDDDANAAQVNWPVTTQNLLETRRNARTEIRLGSTAIRLDADSELEVTQLDDEQFSVRLIYGSVYVRIKSPEAAQDFTLFTPHGRLQLSEPSRIRIDAERTPDSTVLSVLDGAARLTSEESTFTVRAGKRVSVINGETRISTLRPNDLQDDFDSWAAARDQRDDQSQSVRYVSAETTGYEDLDSYGSWQTTEEYGAVWYPRSVASDWAPYQEGRWVWVEPWGWTWVDNAPWGYAPFHYGRWVWYRRHWCWAPGTIVARPIWAPAMVGWVGGANWNVSFSAGAAPAVGWFPLAPREVYVPSYRVSPDYMRRVNTPHVTNITNITIVNGYAHVPPHADYENRRVRNAVSVMPQSQFNANTRGVVVAAPVRGANPRRYLENAPISATIPAAIERPNGFGRHDRDRNESPRNSSAPGQQQRGEQRNTPQNDPPTVRLQPPNNERPGSVRRPDAMIDRRDAPPATQQNTAPSNAKPETVRRPDAFIDRRSAFPAPSAPVVTPSTPPTTAHQEMIGRPRVMIDRRDTPPVTTPPANAPSFRETPRVAPAPNFTQDAERDRERVRGEQEARVRAEAQARALREQQNAQQPAREPLKHAVPHEQNEVQRERMRPQEKPPVEIRKEKAPAELRKEDRPDMPKEGGEGRHR